MAAPDSNYISELEPTGFVDTLEVRCNGETKNNIASDCGFLAHTTRMMHLVYTEMGRFWIGRL